MTEKKKKIKVMKEGNIIIIKVIQIILMKKNILKLVMMIKMLLKILKKNLKKL